LSDHFYLKSGLRLAKLLVWKPEDDDQPFDQDLWLRARPELVITLEAAKIKTRGSGEAKEFCLSNGNLKTWVAIFAKVLNALEVQVETLTTSNQPTEDEISEFIHATATLYALTQVFEKYPQIFDDTSLRGTLLAGLKTPPRATRNPLGLDRDDGRDDDSAGTTPSIHLIHPA
jgi:hypothetical protein